MNDVSLILGRGDLYRTVPEAGRLLQKYRSDTGSIYLDYTPSTPPDQVLLEYLAVTLLVNSQAKPRACDSLVKLGHTIRLIDLPNVSLEDSSHLDRVAVANVIESLVLLPGFGTSVATKLLHKKRPSLIPILDNQAIFYAYLEPRWPEKPAKSYTVLSEKWILVALNQIAFDLKRPENEEAWRFLSSLEPSRTRIQLFDSVWWGYFRELQPVH